MIFKVKSLLVLIVCFVFLVKALHHNQDTSAFSELFLMINYAKSKFFIITVQSQV